MGSDPTVGSWGSNRQLGFKQAAGVLCCAPALLPLNTHLRVMPTHMQVQAILS